MLKVAMLSGWHVHARGYANELNSIPEVEITAVWDEDQERGKEWAEDLGVDFETNLDTLLAREDIEGVVVDAPTNMHPEVMVKAAKAGKHIFTEKVMALTVDECKKIEKAVKENDVTFCISFPHRTRSDVLFAKEAVDNGLVGDITSLRIRNAHNGSVADWLPDHFYDEEECGGGAMIDLGAHGMYLARWFLGKPAKITSIFNKVTDREVEDNAISVIEFENKAIAVNETGFVSTNDPFTLEINGTEGSIVIGGPEGGVKINSNKTESKITGWVTPSQLPDPLPHPIEQWVFGILEDDKIHFGLEEGIQLTELMEGAYISYRTGKQVDFETDL
ncbi:MAG: Gfo/Idh/MocA family protein [Halanaerobiaceae bacterium]